MDLTLHRRLMIWGLGAVLAAGLVLAAAGTASAQPPIVSTEVTRFPTESFSDEPTLCQDELYTTTFSKGMAVEHYTYFPDTGALHFHEWAHAKVVAVPLDGTGPTYTGTTRFGHSENFRNFERGELQTHTFLNRFVARGSDGSRAFIKEHEHITFNANGVKTVDFDTTRMVCSG